MPRAAQAMPCPRVDARHVRAACRVCVCLRCPAFTRRFADVRAMLKIRHRYAEIIRRRCRDIDATLIIFAISFDATPPLMMRAR